VRYVEVDGLRVSAIGLGTWQFGSREWGYGDDYASREAPAILTRALELGITLVDTAEAYGFGRSERIVGETLAGRRAGVTIATKAFPILPLPAILGRQADGSLRRLGVDRIDLYQLHWPNPLVPPRTTMSGLRRLLDDGRVARVGVSNYSLGRWRAAERALGRPVVSDQVSFSLANPGPHWDLVPYARERGRLVIAYSPLGQGFLAGAASADRRRTGPRRRNPLFADGSRRRATRLLDAVAAVANAHAASPAQVALAWLVGHENVVAIPGAHSLAQLEENVAAADLALDVDEQAELTREAERFDAGRRL
jgi:aryl-alcohol dehydrogenase-like predicted oxidoreductase